MLTTTSNQAAQGACSTISNAPYRAIKNAVVYVKETYLEQVIAANDQQQLSEIAAKKPGLDSILDSQAQHDRSIVQVIEALKANSIAVDIVYSGKETLKGKLENVDLIVVIGGDGTFLRASRDIGTDIAVVGVNSAPDTSFGHFSLSDGDGFPKILSSIVDGSLQPYPLLRLNLAVDGVPLAVPVLNEVQVAHRHPAGTSRCRLTVGDSVFHHKGSGLLIASSSGSTGFVRSERGRVLSILDRQYTFLERAPFPKIGEIPKTKQGFVDGKEKVVVVSEMQAGMLFIDGEHIEQAFPRGAVLTVTAGERDLLAYVDPDCHAPYIV